MNPIANPFSPGAGAPPPELVGRDSVLEQVKVLFGRVQKHRPEKSIIMTGLRGVGKTVLLNEMERIADSYSFKSLHIEAHGGKPLGVLLAPHLRTLLFEINRLADAGDKARRGLAVLKGFVGAIRLKAGDIELGLDIDSEIGTADSGDLEVDLPSLFVVVAEAAKERNVCLSIFIDEIQYLKHDELSALVMAMHKIQQRGLPLVLVAGGLPILTGLIGESKSYAERLFSFPDIGALSESDANKALQDPVQEEGVRFDKAALKEIFRLTQGYPYFLQEWGYQAWNRAESSPIELSVIQDASKLVLQRLDENFFRVRFDRLTPTEKKFLRTMAELGSGSQRTSRIADSLGVEIGSIGPVRAKLIHKGMVFSPSFGELAFTVPLFDEYMKRIMPEFPVVEE
ncbi:MAG: AAA family ATPase [Proteobacteria bacterium]|nr:MAG: AAA family ATPase [Pseudomonadota bacterium]